MSVGKYLGAVGGNDGEIYDLVGEVLFLGVFRVGIVILILLHDIQGGPSIFGQKFGFLVKNSIFGQKFDFLVKNSVFRYRSVRFSTKIAS